MINRKPSLRTLQNRYLPLFINQDKPGNREVFRNMGRLAHEFRLNLPHPIAQVSPKESVSLWIVHAQGNLSPYGSALISGRFILSHFSDEESTLLAIKQSVPKICLIASEFISLIDTFRKEYPDVQLVISSCTDMRNTIPLLIERPGLGHLIFDQAASSSFMQQDLLASCEKIASGDIFGLEKYLDQGAYVVENVITGNEARRTTLDQLTLDLNRAGLSSTLTQKARHLADELLMNAIYDAPIDRKTNQPRYNHLTRAVSVELEPSEYAYFRYGFDGTLLALSIEDPFGALPRDIILKYLESCYAGEFGKLNEKEGKGGGGMGLYQILSSADLLVANIAPGERTELIAILNTSERLSSHVHSFHYFQGKIPQFTGESAIEQTARILPQVIESYQKLCESKDSSAEQLLSDQIRNLASVVPESITDDPDVSIVLLSANKNLQRNFRATLGAGHYRAEVFEDLHQLKESNPPTLLLIEDRQLDDWPTLQKKFPDTKLMAISDRHAKAALEELKAVPTLSQVLSLDLPKSTMRKMLLTHINQFLCKHSLQLSNYLSFGAEIKELTADFFQNLPKPIEELERLRSLEEALLEFRNAESLLCGFDSKLFAMHMEWSEALDRNSLLDLFHPTSDHESVKMFYENAHAIVLGSDGMHHQLVVLRFVSDEQIEPYLYTFFKADQ